MENRTCQVAIVSPLEVVATGLATMLSSRPDRVQLVELEFGFDSCNPDVVLYDAAGLHESDGSDLENLVKETTSAVLVVDQELRPDLGARALALGADGFFPLGVDAEELLAAVESAASGLVGGDEEADPASGSAQFLAREQRLGHDVGLTDREIDVLTLITQGLSNLEIAQQTYLSINSVKTYIRSAYRRIDVTTRSQAAVWCIQHGFAPPAE